MNISCCKSYVGKQIIGLLPSQADCLFYYSPNVDVDKWTIDGVQVNDIVAVNDALNPYGYTFYFFENTQITDSTYKFILSYIGASPPTYLPVILDSGSNPVTWTLTNCCDKVCLEGTFDSTYSQFFQTGYGYNLVTAVSFNDSSIEIFIKALYGQQTIYTPTDNGDGTFYIKIDNAYACGLILAWSADDVTYTDMVPCGTPVCLFTSGSYSDSTGNTCFTTPGYDFNGQGIDFTAAANVYGGYAIQYGNPTTLPYGGDTCSIVTFSYIGYSQPADIIVNDPTFGVINLPLLDQYCEKGCLTTNSILLKDTYDGTSIVNYIILPFSSFGTTTLDFVNDMVGAETYLNVILSKFCPGATCNVTSDGADYFTITFNDIYYNPSFLDFKLYDNSGIPSISTILVPC